MYNQHGIYVNYSLRMHTRMYLHMWSNDVKEFLPDGPSQSLPRWAPEIHAACIIQDQKTMDTACKTKDKQKQLPA